MADTDHSSEKERQVKTILIVEDDTDIGEFIVEALKMETAYHVLYVTEATSALETVKTVTPDLFVLDYQLPGINGLELADRLQASEALKPIPILLMSANLPTQELEKRHIASIDKPFEVETLLQTIEHLLAS